MAALNLRIAVELGLGRPESARQALAELPQGADAQKGIDQACTSASACKLNTVTAGVAGCSRKHKSAMQQDRLLGSSLLSDVLAPIQAFMAGMEYM